MKLKGIGVSGGYAVGTAYTFNKALPEIAPRTVHDTAAEKRRFHDALRVYCDRTGQRARLLSAKVGHQEAAILRGHIGIAQDPFLIEESERMLENGKSAEEAIVSLCDMFISIFSASGDDVTRQRAADVRDVKEGVLRLLLNLEDSGLCSLPDRTVLVVHELTPSMVAEIDKTRVAGVVAETGGQTSHSAILARAMELPVVMGASGASEQIRSGSVLIVDGAEGIVLTDPDELLLHRYAVKSDRYLQELLKLNDYRGRPSVTADGVAVKVMCNIGRPEDALAVTERDGEGVGLFRTEFLYMDQPAAPTEEEQFEAYRQAALTMGEKPLIIRTLDVGGDKKIPALGLPREDNPFMGLRAIRFCLSRPELFRVQLRALLRASIYGNIRIMLPMITCLEELLEARRMIDAVKKELSAEAIPFNEQIPVGIMVETASAAVIADLLAQHADFFSIGTNDLTGYIMACDRGNEAVSQLFSVYQPAVLRMIRRTIQCARDRGIPVGMCGEAAADPLMLPLLIAFGLEEYSVSPPSVLRLRKALKSWTQKEAQQVAEAAMQRSSAEEIADFLQKAVALRQKK